MNDFNNILRTLNIVQPAAEAVPSVYFLGIGGIGMSALARYFKALGVAVSGYDKTPTALTNQLTTEGIEIHFEDNLSLLDKQAQLVIYTPAIPAGHLGFNFYRQNNYAVVKRSDVLGAITDNSFNICVAGTHGKTTTSTMVAHLLTDSGFGCNAFLGGIAVNYNSNFWSSKNNVCVVEADEYDRSFLKLSPDVAVISSMDADHLDIYGTATQMEDAFIDFSKKVKPGGLLISKYGLPRSSELNLANQLTYHATDGQADIHAVNLVMKQGSYRFDVSLQKPGVPPWLLTNVVLNMGGLHNIENMVAAIAVAHHAGVADDKIISAVASFRGVKRRFEYILNTDRQVYIDDYAHHPEELKALIGGAKSMFPGKKCTLVFQPHLFSRTRDLADEFAAALDLADEVILLPIYPAREQPMAGVNSEMIVARMRNENRIVMSKENVLSHFTQEQEAHVEEGFDGKLVITAGAGDIDTLVSPIREILRNQ